MSSFFEKYTQRKKKLASVLCLGLDPDPKQIPDFYHRTNSNITQVCQNFIKDIILATREYTIAYKINCAFFEAMGLEGMQLFSEIIKIVRLNAPGALCIVDAKRGDVPHSAAAYAKAYFQSFACDAVTVNPYLGLDCLAPFWEYPQHASMVLCRTSNHGASQFQNIGDPPLYLQIADAINKENQIRKNLWLVVGATNNPEILKQIKTTAPLTPFLVPGVGKQGGDLEQCLELLGTDVLINVGRTILYCTNKGEDIVPMAQEICEQIVLQMRKFI